MMYKQYFLKISCIVDWSVVLNFTKYILVSLCYVLQSYFLKPFLIYSRSTVTPVVDETVWHCLLDPALDQTSFSVGCPVLALFIEALFALWKISPNMVQTFSRQKYCLGLIQHSGSPSSAMPIILCFAVPELCQMSALAMVTCWK